jgi:divalent metal cation (Fe/Co/Zn/Cd) transporter
VSNSVALLADTIHNIADWSGFVRGG